MTELIVTIGPSTQDEATLEQLLDLGVGQFRFAASKLTFDALRQQAERVCMVASRCGRNVQTWLDLPGTKPRLDIAATGTVLAAGSHLHIAFGEGAKQANLRVLGMDMDQMQIVPGDVLVIGDGEQALETIALQDGGIDTVVLAGGKLGKAKGIAVVGKPVRHASLSPADVAILEQLAGNPFTGVIISFCETAADIHVVRDLLTNGSMRLIAKIETVAGAHNTRAIAAIADVVLLGRGDLLVDSGPIEFHACCEQILAQAHAVGKPVYVGTQLLPSLSTMWLPHRSELSCLSQLIADGVDGLMLANETSTGNAPLRTVAILGELIRRYGRERAQA